MGNRCADHVTPLYPQKLALTSSTGGGRSVGIVRSRTKGHGVFMGWLEVYGVTYPTNFSSLNVLIQIVGLQIFYIDTLILIYLSNVIG